MRAKLLTVGFAILSALGAPRLAHASLQYNYSYPLYCEVYIDYDAANNRVLSHSYVEDYNNIGVLIWAEDDLYIPTSGWGQPAAYFDDSGYGWVDVDVNESSAEFAGPYSAHGYFAYWEEYLGHWVDAPDLVTGAYAGSGIPGSVAGWVAGDSGPGCQNGFLLDVAYQVYDTWGLKMPDSGMDAYEDVTDIQESVDGGAPQSRPSRYGVYLDTTAGGVFHDFPLGQCTDKPGWTEAFQTLYIDIGNESPYVVRTNGMVFTATGPNSGMVANGNEITVLR